VTPPAWRSPRKAAETAIQMGERWIDEYEHYLGRSLKPAEMAEVHAKARHVAAQQGQETRAAASVSGDLQDDLAEAELTI
jgi:hypothetical protein